MKVKVKLDRVKDKIESEVHDIRTVNAKGKEEIQFLVYLGTKYGWRYVEADSTELIKG